ncbi:MAG: xanthine dehydrogenase family protein subunit M [Anaerolineae bacterium]|jgi:CO/xanthine dehydrogenase FAD-binding subunit
MREVSYFAPTEVGEAVKVLAEHGEEAAILAGGTDLVAALNYYEIKPGALVYIGGLGLDYIKEEDDKLVIGAGTTGAQLIASDLLAEKFPVLVDAAKTHGSPAVRSTATIGGNLGTGSPAGDLIPPLMVMDAEVLLASAEGERVVAVQDFFTGPQETVCKAGELIVEIRVPLKPGKAAFNKLGRRVAQTCALASATARLEMDGKVCKDARIVLGSMAPTPLRCTEAEAMITGKELDEGLIAKCAAKAIGESSPIDDQRATAWYRKKAGKALVARAVAQAAGI